MASLRIQSRALHTSAAAFKRALNFSAGPASLPMSVLETAQKEFVDWHNSGMSVVEMSHRGKFFPKIITEAEQDLRDLLNIPANYKVLFMQGGGTGQFACVPLNLLGSGNVNADYVVTGAWSEKAHKEAQKWVGAYAQNIANSKDKNYTYVPDFKTWKVNSHAAYLHYCMNETIHGVEYNFTPEVKAPLVCDMSSNFLSRPIDVSKFGLIYAGAQKNVAPAGLAIVIAREDLIKKPREDCPSVMQYKWFAEEGSMPNTPPEFPIYMAGLVFKHLKKLGGLAEVEKINIAKAKVLYDAIDNSNGFYKSPVEKSVRSRMNIPFRVNIAGKEGEALEDKFCKEAEAAGMYDLKGHRSVGGIRASLYNSVPIEWVKELTGFMHKFAVANRK